MKKVRTSKKVRNRVASKRHARSLRSRAKQAHRRGVGYKDLEQAEG
ncbi:MAG: hypothetical protein K1X75_10565 [Leptospirales bacterium]|nr:hypothetical protein [Leptospirales bacterium]